MLLTSLPLAPRMNRTFLGPQTNHPTRPISQSPVPWLVQDTIQFSGGVQPDVAPGSQASGAGGEPPRRPPGGSNPFLPLDESDIPDPKKKALEQARQAGQQARAKFKEDNPSATPKELQRAYQKAYKNVYNQSECGKATQKKYRQSEKGKAAKRDSSKAYYQSKHGKATRKTYERSECGKATQKKYSQSEKGKAVRRDANKKYSQSEHGKATRKTYERSECGKATRKAYYQSEKGKACTVLEDLGPDALPPEKCSAAEAAPILQQYLKNRGVNVSQQGLVSAIKTQRKKQKSTPSEDSSSFGLQNPFSALQLERPTNLAEAAQMVEEGRQMMAAGYNWQEYPETGEPGPSTQQPIEQPPTRRGSWSNTVYKFLHPNGFYSNATDLRSLDGSRTAYDKTNNETVLGPSQRKPDLWYQYE